MAQTKIVLADLDEGYVLPLERALIREYGHTAEYCIITNQDYLEQFFAVPQSVDILIIARPLYNQSFSKHNITNLFVLTEEREAPAGWEGLPVHWLYKYGSVREILENIINRSGVSNATSLHLDTAKVVMVYSPAGGAGKTSVAAGICAALAKSFRRALFIGVDSLQTSGYLLQGGQRLQPGTEKTLLHKSEYAFEKVRPMVVSEMFDIMPPFSSSLASLGVTMEHFSHLINLIKQSGSYDYIILDSGSDLSLSSTSWMAYADQVVLVGMQDENSVYKMDRLLENIDCSDSHRFVLLCNRYSPEEENRYLLSGKVYPQTVYLERDAGIHPRAGEYMAGLPSVQNLAQLLL